jgi:hypothetical protein
MVKTLYKKLGGSKMDWRTIKRVRMEIERTGFFVEKVKEDCFLCTHLDDKEEVYYMITPNENDYDVKVINKNEFKALMKDLEII